MPCFNKLLLQLFCRVTKTETWYFQKKNGGSVALKCHRSLCFRLKKQKTSLPVIIRRLLGHHLFDNISEGDIKGFVYFQHNSNSLVQLSIFLIDLFVWT